ncbi:DUF3802 domain-containing protein [Aliidiomarina taiwanensis]|uniref:DUF3802 domain-containing protein n=1 Tax=Aliidiomarina taiwanensis TaxID=946228 RepID=A0A432WYZ5_9GAMM|nr:DUF3802 family protein [Aliidiomarina taiwanensis]RUO38911.1 DUF3802 domain-containing protein [Aliidiomarina taiwanensis]
MITQSKGYIELVQYLTEHLDVFTQPDPDAPEGALTVRECFEEQLAESVMQINQQHSLDETARLEVVREADAILYDLEEVLSSVLDKRPSPTQEAFIVEFVGLVKNLFDSKIMS